MKKVDIKEKARLLNDFIQKNQGRVMSTQEIKSALKSLLTKNDNIIVKVLHSFPCEVMGSSKMYEIPKTPIYMGVIEKAYQAQRAASRKSANKKKIGIVSDQKPSVNNAEDAWQVLIDKGLVKRKLDVGLLKSKYPSVYLECLSYEIVK